MLNIVYDTTNLVLYIPGSIGASSKVREHGVESVGVLQAEVGGHEEGGHPQRACEKTIISTIYFNA